MIGLFLACRTETLAEDQVQFMRLLPEPARLFLHDGLGHSNHVQPILGLGCLLLADTDLVAEVAPRDGVVGLAVVGSDAGAGPDELPDKRQRDDILGRVNVLDMVIPLFETIGSRSVVDKPLASLKGIIPTIDGLRMKFDSKKKVTTIHLIVPPGVTDGKAFAAAVNRKKEGFLAFLINMYYH